MKNAQQCNASWSGPSTFNTNFVACETLQLPHWSHANFVSSSLFLLRTFRRRLGQRPPKWKRTPQQTQMRSKKEHLVKDPQPYLSVKNQFPIISGNHWLSTDWKLTDFFFLIILTKKLVMHMKPFMCITPSLLPYCTSSTEYRTRFYMLYSQVISLNESRNFWPLVGKVEIEAP